jgi:hypothetical protein
MLSKRLKRKVPTQASGILERQPDGNAEPKWMQNLKRT